MQNDFERQYYEDESFWVDSLTDPRNVDRIKRTADLIPPNIKSLVDVGCGNGVFLNFLLKDDKRKIKLLGIDRSKTALSFVQSEKLEASADDIPLPKESFDCVSCLEVIEHLPVGIYEKALMELTRIARQYVIISVPYQEDLLQSFNECPQCKSTFSYEMHLRSFDDNEIRTLLDPYGFKCVKTHHMGPSQTLVGHDTYKKIFYPELSKKFQSPICPICGFNNPKNLEPKKSINHIPTAKRSRKQSILSKLTALPKLLWPKKVQYYWIAAVYSRT